MARERYPIKLVRDRIRDVPNVVGGEVQVWAVGSITRTKMLRAKLLEEVGEYLIDGGIDELADLLEVIEAIGVLVEGTDFGELREIQLAKRLERGGFRDGQVMFAVAPTPPADQQEGEHRGS